MNKPAESAAAESKCAVVIPGSDVSSNLIKRVQDLSGQQVMACYQCGECTAGCPMAFAMDLMPNRVMRMVQVGCAKPTLESSSIWLCAGCETCATRCPKGVELSKVMDALRQIAIADGVRARESDVVKFHKAFLDAIQRHGRVHEVTMLIRLKLATGKLFNDMILGAKMFMKGKLALMPNKVKDVHEVRRIFEELGGKK